MNSNTINSPTFSRGTTIIDEINRHKERQLALGVVAQEQDIQQYNMGKGTRYDNSLNNGTMLNLKPTGLATATQGSNEFYSQGTNQAEDNTSINNPESVHSFFTPLSNSSLNSSVSSLTNSNASTLSNSSVDSNPVSSSDVVSNSSQISSVFDDDTVSELGVFDRVMPEQLPARTLNNPIITTPVNTLITTTNLQNTQPMPLFASNTSSNKLNLEPNPVANIRTIRPRRTYTELYALTDKIQLELDQLNQNLLTNNPVVATTEDNPVVTKVEDDPVVTEVKGDSVGTKVEDDSVVASTEDDPEDDIEKEGLEISNALDESIKKYETLMKENIELGGTADSDFVIKYPEIDSDMSENIENSINKLNIQINDLSQLNKKLINIPNAPEMSYRKLQKEYNDLYTLTSNTNRKPNKNNTFAYSNYNTEDNKLFSLNGKVVELRIKYAEKLKIKAPPDTIQVKGKVGRPRSTF